VYDAWSKLQVPVTNKLLLRMHKGLIIRAERLSASDNVTVLNALATMMTYP
jgi:hypothetical protein